MHVSIHARGAVRRPVRSRGLAVLLALLSLSSPAAAGPQEYTLGPQDKVRVKLVEWRSGNGVAVEWESLSDDYAVSAGGKISVPMLGEFDAAGKSTSQLSVEIAERLRERVGMPTRPEASVEIVTYRPFYVLGSVEKPGEYAFRPGLTAMQAIGVAGGVYRPSDMGLLRLERDRLTAVGPLEGARNELQRGLVRRARLEAELQDKTAFGPFPTLQNEDVASIVASETAIAKARSVLFKAQIQAAEATQKLFAEQIKSLEAKIATQDRQIDISRRELQTYRSLTSQGLAVASRQFALERAAADDESRRLDYEMAALNAKQELRKAEQSAVDLKNERISKIRLEISETQGLIDQSQAKVRMNEGLLDEASRLAPFAVTDREDAARRQPQFRLLRQQPDGSARTVPANEDTLLQPADVITVILPPPGRSSRSATTEAADAISVR